MLPSPRTIQLTRMNGRSGWRRLVAGPTLALLVLSVIGSPLSTGSAEGSCPAPQGSGMPTLVSDVDHDACTHAGLGLCVSANGCVTVSAALRSTAPSFTAAPVILVVGTVGAVRHELFRSSPPTPPPDLV